jgi:glycosyltransferase involved in cell wall biosynthesis
VTSISIVVPTRNRPDALRRCLAALVAQEGIGSPEIVVVDDGGAEPLAVAAVVDEQPGTRLVRLDGCGPAAARNAGVRAAAGEVVCFTDDDCEPSPTWSSRLVACLDEGADAAGGTSVSGRLGDPFVNASELILRELQRSTSHRLLGRVFIPSNNLACRRDLVVEHPFDEQFRRAAGEDRAWCARVASAGKTLVLAEGAVVAHSPQLGLGGFWRQHVRYGHGARIFAGMQPGADWEEPRSFYLTLLREGLRGGPACAALIVLAQIATTAGYLREAISADGR